MSDGFQRQLETLNAHPERWAMVEVFLWSWDRVNEAVIDDKFAMFVINTHLKMEKALKLIGISSINDDTARQLLAARETGSEGE